MANLRNFYRECQHDILRKAQKSRRYLGLVGYGVTGWAYTLCDGSIDWDASVVERNHTTVYVGGLYEKNLTNNEETSYYFAGSQRVAMRNASGLYYFVADHLGSTSLTLDANGTKIGEMRYKPFGETRYIWGGTPTDRRYTGQREENGLGSLYDFNARFYLPALGRFLSADTIVPDGKNPQAFNRYSYGLGNPVKYTDPSGHYIFENGVDDDPTASTTPASRCGICTAQNAFLSPATAQRDYGVNVAMRLSQETWSNDVGTPLQTRLNSLKEDMDKLSYTGFGSQGSACGGADALVGGDMCISGQVMVNPRAGQVGVFYTTMLVPRIGIPNIASGSISGGPMVAPGVSNLRNLAGRSQIVGIDAGAQAGLGLGVAGQRSDSVNTQGQPLIDFATGLPVTSYTVGPQASANVLPTAIDGSIKGGDSYTHGCVLSFSSLSVVCQ